MRTTGSGLRLAMIATLVMAGVISGCGGDDGSATTASTSAPQTSRVYPISQGPTPAPTTTSAPAVPVEQVAGPNPAVGANAVTLSWDAPDENTDGSPLMNLKGYKVHYGSKSRTYSDTIQVSNPGLTTFVVQNLAAGNYFFAVTAYNSRGEESELSGEVTAQVD